MESLASNNSYAAYDGIKRSDDLNSMHVDSHVRSLVLGLHATNQQLVLKIE